ncbi:ribosomal RNA small subunit methyltransferase A [Clostridium sp. UBA4548]|uniref:ribosomal RNA small subunit methyltransferase A n=1 Tax=Clostridium sp. UBA4548 TaxID=1946361 RepID=UPI0025B92AD9|nr:rRNA adenine N(6)-methyltransferase family protein [Clostridium sp. UBA4548]
MADNNIEINHSLPIHYSQNYLACSGLIDRLIQQSSIRSNDEVLDIGAGKGIITKELLNLGCKVISVELDQKNILYLKKQFKNETQCTLIFGNFLELPLPEGNYKIFSNIPFFITSDVLDKITQAKNPPIDSYLILQKQAAMKYCGSMKTTLKSLLLKPRFNMMIVHQFSRNDFSPRPNVDIVLLRIQKRNVDELTIEEFEVYRDFICYCYKNNKTFPKKIFTYRQLKELRKRHGITNYRTSEMRYEEWIILFRCFLQYISDEKKSQVRGSYSQYLLQESLLKKQFRSRG